MSLLDHDSLKNFINRSEYRIKYRKTKRNPLFLSLFEDFSQ